MCGIAGWVDFTAASTTPGNASSVLAAMTDELACRGPDGVGQWLAPHVALGHRRLSVIDPAGGHQPMIAAVDGRSLAVITYCSEVYNYRDLRTELMARGHHFTTSCDTEVVLHAYLEWGEDFVDRLNGIYAFAIWDIARQALIMVRDRLGVKPLYYQRTPAGVRFGSELKALLAHPQVRPVVDIDGLRELLSLAATPGHAGYRDIRQVIPGELVRVDRTGVHTRRYWRLPERGHTDDRPTTIDTVRGLLEDIVDRQLVADVPLGVLLSGGLDSSVITALAARALRARGGGPVRTFAVDFEGYLEGFRPEYMRETPDAPYVAMMAAHVGAEHRDVTLSTADLLDPGNRMTALRALDLPYARGDRDTTMYLLCRAVREHCTVVLTGESADEVFGGYWWFHDPAIVAGDTFPWLAMFGHPLDDGVDSTTSLLDPALLKQLDLPAYRADAYRTALAEVPHAEMPHAGTADGTVATERRMRELAYLGLTRLLPLLVDRAERLSMAAPLELRVPFLDHRLVEYVFATPWATKSFDGREKSLLRAATRDLLPHPIAERRKAPFPATQDVAYELGLRRELTALLDRPGSRVAALLNLDRARRLVTTPPPAHTANESRAQVELVLRLASWLERYPVDLDLTG